MMTISIDSPALPDTGGMRNYLPHLYRIAQLFGLALDLDEVLVRVMEEVVAATGAERGFLLMCDEFDRLTVRTARNRDGTFVNSPDDQLSREVVDRVCADGQPLLTAVPQQDVPGLRSVLCVPLHIRGETPGLLYVENSVEAGAFSAADLDLMTALANQSAIAIENARLFCSVREQVDSLRVLHDITADLTSTLDLQRVLTGCLERVQQLLGTKAGSIMMLEGEELVFKVAIGEKAAEVRPFRFPRTQGVAGWVATTGRSTYTNDVHADSRYTGMVDRQTGFVTQMLMAAPLVVRERVIGVLEVFNKPGGFNDGDMSLLSTIAASAAIAIENARLYEVAVEKGRLEQELRVARQVQANLIPRQTPHIPGWEFAARWQSALEVSGDFYDFIVREDAPLGIVIGDVADKGMAAALFMTLTRTNVRASVGMEYSPFESIRRANALVCADATDGMFVTLCYAQLDPQRAELTYVNAGHPAPLHFRAALGELSELAGHSIPLGIDDTVPYSQESVLLDTDDIVVFYTDGVTDALNSDGEEFGKARLLHVVRDQCLRSGDKVHLAIDRALSDFMGGTPAADDATFVVLRRRG
jgi:sigma-B regulation protein RsbU (phosphoserine phosphatase)